MVIIDVIGFARACTTFYNSTCMLAFENNIDPDRLL